MKAMYISLLFNSLVLKSEAYKGGYVHDPYLVRDVNKIGGEAKAMSEYINSVGYWLIEYGKFADGKAAFPGPYNQSSSYANLRKKYAGEG